MKVSKYLLITGLSISILWGTHSNAEPFVKPYVASPPNSEKAAPPKRKPGAHGKHNPHVGLTPEKHIQLALQHKAEGRIGDAFIALDQAITLNQKSAELFAVRGSFYLEQNDVSRALNDFESALDIAPDSAAILTNRAQAYRHFGRINEALQDLNKAITLNSNLVAAYFNRGAIYYSSQEFAHALKDFDSCIAIDPHQAGPYFNRASVKDALGDHQGAIADVQQFIELTQNNSWRKTAQQLLDKWSAMPKKTENSES